MQIQLPLKNKTTRRRVRLVFPWTLAKRGAARGVPHLPMDLPALTALPPGKHPQRDAPETLGVLPHLPSAGSAASWMQMEGVAGFLLLGEPKQNRQWMSRPWRPNTAVTAARTKPGAFTRAEEDSSSQPLLGSGYL